MAKYVVAPVREIAPGGRKLVDVKGRALPFLPALRFELPANGDAATSVHVLGLYLPYIYLFGFLLAVGLLGIMFAILYRTRFGASVRAAMQDRTAASLVGVDVRRVATITFGIGTATTAAGGMTISTPSGNRLAPSQTETRTRNGPPLGSGATVLRVTPVSMLCHREGWH